MAIGRIGNMKVEKCGFEICPWNRSGNTNTDNPFCEHPKGQFWIHTEGGFPAGCPLWLTKAMEEAK